jgi:predicted nucleic-acid-binding protein
VGKFGGSLAKVPASALGSVAITEVLKRAGLTGEQVALALEAILRTKQLVVERGDQVMRALRAYGEGKADFADCLIERSAAGAGRTQTMTFDVGASKHAGMALIT